LLIRRHISEGELAFFTTWCPAATRGADGARKQVRDIFRRADSDDGTCTIDWRARRVSDRFAADVSQETLALFGLAPQM
jgi:hypothetical protein